MDNRGVLCALLRNSKSADRAAHPAAARRAAAAGSLFLLGLLSAVGEIGAQSRSIRFEHLSLEEGLSQVTVTCVLQDRAGFLWLGTQDGLNRYDGSRFEVHKHDPTDPASLPSDWVNALAEDPSGDLWIGTEGGGLIRWHRDRGTFTAYRHDAVDPASLSGDRVRALSVDRLGGLWIGTFDSGLNRLDRESGIFERFRHQPRKPTSLSGDRIRTIYEDRAGNLWIGGNRGLNLLDRSAAEPRFVRFRHRPEDPQSLGDDDVLSIAEDHAGALWIGTGAGLQRLDRGSQSFARFTHDPDDPTSLSQNRVRAIYEDRARRLWVGTDGGGLNLLRRPSPPGGPGGRRTAPPGGRAGFEHYRHDVADPSSLSDDRVIALFEDRTGVLWVTTQGRGVNKWNPRTWAFSHYKADPDRHGLSGSAVFAFSQDAKGRLWIGTTDGGLNVFDRASGRFTAHRHDPADPASLGDGGVVALLHDRQGTLWVGTLASGLSRLDPGGRAFRHYRADPERTGALSHDVIAALFEDRRGDLWIGTHGGGLNRFHRDSGTFHRFRHRPDDPRSLSDDRTISFAEGSDGQLWIGTFGGGLNRFDPETETFTALRHDPERSTSLSNDTVMSLHVDPAGSLWIGTEEGLNRLPGRGDEGALGDIFERYYERNGLPNNVIYGIRSEPRGTLWISTVNGLSRFDPRQRTFTNYNTSHGLQSNEFNFGAHFQNPAGELFFGGINGFNVFDPQAVQRNTAVPPVVLTAVTKMNQPVRFERPLADLEEITLSHRDTFFALEFAALDYTAPSENRYRYRLEGADESWISLGGERRVSFTRLPPGRYRLRVQGSNNDGVWNHEGIALDIRVTPPVWKTWWFRSLGLLALAAGVFGAWELKIRSVRKNSERLQTLVRERTVELEEAQEQLLRRERLAALGELAGCVAHEIRNPLGVIKNSIYFLRLTQKLADAKAKKHLGLIDQEVDRSNRIITELLDYARNPTLETRRFHLPEIAGKALAELEVPDSVILERQLGQASLTVEADSGQVERILSNLLANAVQAMPDGGILRLECRRREGEAIAEIVDTGVGIEEESLSKIFEPLFTSKAHGIGLGLALSQRYAELNRGRIECETRLGQGTTFRLVLPLVEDGTAE